MWTEGRTIGVPYYSPAEYKPVVFCLDTGDGVWHEATVPADVPADAIAVQLVGILIITYGQVDLSESCDMHLRLRRPLGPDSGYSPDYVGQVIEVRSGGVRSPFACWVSIERGKFEWHWTRSTPAGYPKHASYGIKLYVGAYLRP